MLLLKLIIILLIEINYYKNIFLHNIRSLKNNRQINYIYKSLLYNKLV